MDKEFASERAKILLELEPGLKEYRNDPRYFPMWLHCLVPTYATRVFHD